MILETWVVSMFMAFLFVLVIVCSIGWLISNQRYEEACEEIRVLNGCNQLFVTKNAKLNFELNLMRAKIESEEKR